MIETVIDSWQRHLRGDLPGGLDELLHDDVVMYSPIIHTPLVGRATVARYLEAAGVAFVGGRGDDVSSERDGSTARFRYTRTTFNEDTAVLEFETTMGGKYVNGVDIIRADPDGRIVEFRVMVRPLQAVHAVHELMRATLAADGSSATAP